jgi:hypothetical protein
LPSISSFWEDHHRIVLEKAKRKWLPVEQQIENLNQWHFFKFLVDLIRFYPFWPVIKPNLMFLFDGIKEFMQADLLIFAADYFLLNILGQKRKIQKKKAKGDENYFQEDKIRRILHRLVGSELVGFFGICKIINLL